MVLAQKSHATKAQPEKSMITMKEIATYTLPT